MFRVFSCAVAVLLGACSFLLDDPTAFRADEVDAAPDAEAVDAEPRPDLPDAFVPREFPDSRVPDPPDMRGVDRDGGPGGPDATPDAAVDACVPLDERCNGFDDDCDGRADEGLPAEEVCNGFDDDCDNNIDEADPRACRQCGVAGGRGLCSIGKFVCNEGVLRCVAWLPDAGDALECDDVDNDCDGNLDEADEVVRPRALVEQRVVDECGARPAEGAVPDAECTADPRIVGCAPVHACVHSGCRANCLDDAASTEALCDPACDDPDPVAQATCRDACRAPVRDSVGDCLAACGRDFSTGASRWACTGGVGRPNCTALDCPVNTHPDGPNCVPD